MRCHACGHDGHAALAFWGRCAICMKSGPVFKRARVRRALFQPAEEIGRGALRVVQSGVFEHWGIQEIYGAHDEPTVAKGQYGLCAGPAQASTDFFYITVKGRGVHAARPHLGVDPITTAGVLIGALQTIVSRKVNPIETAVLSISSVNGGNFHTPNVIPETVTLSGTVRTFNPKLQKELPGMIERIIKSTCEAYRAEYEFDYYSDIPATINDEYCSGIAAESVRKILGDKGLVKYAGTPGGEDFSYFLEKFPGVYAFVGCRNESKDCCYSLHNERFDLDEDALVNGAAFYVQYVLDAQEKFGAV